MTVRNNGLILSDAEVLRVWVSQPTVVTAGTDGQSYAVRSRPHRSPGSHLNGEPEKLTPTHTVKTELQHVVYTRNAVGEESIYVDGMEVASGIRTGTCSFLGVCFRLRE
mgnify:CR=1 FL=1